MNFIISIGGSGSKCMESLIYLMAAKFLPSTEPYRVFVVDKDANCGNTNRCRNTIGSYHTLRKAVEGQPYAEPSLQECTWCFEDSLNEIVRMKGRTVQNSLCQGGHDQQLLDMIFSRSEQTEDLVNGFYGHPAMGAAVFEAVSLTGSYQNSELFRAIQEAVSSGTQHINIFLMASIFGGTGASMFPNVARSIRDRFCQGGANLDKISIGGALLMPYFRFPNQQEGEQQRINSITYEDFMEKTAVALRYYDGTRGLVKNASVPGDYIFDSIYVMGCAPFTQTCAVNTAGGEKQKHKFHVVDLFAALSAAHFFQNPNGTGEKLQIFVPQLDPNDTERIGWDNLPGGTETKNRLVSFARFSVFVLSFLKPYVDQDLKILQKEKLICKIYGKSWGKSIITPEQLEELRQAVGDTAAFCQRYLSYLLDIQKKAAQEDNPDCNFFDEQALERLLQAVDAGVPFEQLQKESYLDRIYNMDTGESGKDILNLLSESAPELKYERNNPQMNIPRDLLSKSYEYCSVLRR